VKLQPFSNEIMAACYKAATEVYDEFATKNAKFKKVYDSWKKFRNDQNQWFAVAESRFDNFMIAAERLTSGVRERRARAQVRELQCEAPRVAGLSFPGMRASAISFGRRRRARARGPFPPAPARSPARQRPRAIRRASPSHRRALDLDVPDVDRLLLGDPPVYDTREGDDERHHDHLDQHERHRSPVDLAGRDTRGLPAGDLVDVVLRRGDAPQIEKCETRTAGA